MFAFAFDDFGVLWSLVVATHLLKKLEIVVQRGQIFGVHHIFNQLYSMINAIAFKLGINWSRNCHVLQVADRDRGHLAQPGEGHEIVFFVRRVHD